MSDKASYIEASLLKIHLKESGADTELFGCGEGRGEGVQEKSLGGGPKLSRVRPGNIECKGH